ncbi:TPA: winged helix-turn-helix transcriptional regulator [Candidatus Poribacteria bacterium]|nr:winged helix-turn-helix transcriptional regulator [Candidatus Poribacteria bacterium]
MNATITCVLFQGRDKYKILDQKEFEGDLYSNYQDAFTYLQSKLNTEYIIKGGPREEKLELPKSALREAILNAIAHRNYFLNANIQVYIFSNRAEITNPGGLPPGMSYFDLGKKSMPRNFLLFGLMQRMGLAEKVGTGILRMNHAMEEYNLEKPVMEVDENWFTIIFKRPELEKESFEGREKSTPQKTTQKILGVIKENPNITRKELASIIGISEDGIKYHIANLKSMGVLERIGPDKGGYWRIVDNDE